MRNDKARNRGLLKLVRKDVAEANFKPGEDRFQLVQGEMMFPALETAIQPEKSACVRHPPTDDRVELAVVKITWTIAHHLL